MSEVISLSSAGVAGSGGAGLREGKMHLCTPLELGYSSVGLKSVLRVSACPTQKPHIVAKIVASSFDAEDLVVRVVFFHVASTSSVRF